MQNIDVLKVEKREIIGTGGARALRRAGKVPATLYGKHKPSVSVFVDEKEVTTIYKKTMFTSKVISLELDGKKVKVVPRAVELHPTQETITHIDFVYLNDDYQLIDMPLLFTNQDKSPGVKKGGFFNIALRRVKVRCPANAIPSHLSISIEHMHVGYKIKASDFVLPEGCVLITPPNRIIASVTGKGGKEVAEEVVVVATPAAKAAPAAKKEKKMVSRK